MANGSLCICCRPEQPQRGQSRDPRGPLKSQKPPEQDNFPHLINQINPPSGKSINLILSDTRKLNQTTANRPTGEKNSQNRKKHACLDPHVAGFTSKRFQGSQPLLPFVDRMIYASMPGQWKAWLGPVAHPLKCGSKTVNTPTYDPPEKLPPQYLTETPFEPTHLSYPTLPIRLFHLTNCGLRSGRRARLSKELC